MHISGQCFLTIDLVLAVSNDKYGVRPGISFPRLLDKTIWFQDNCNCIIQQFTRFCPYQRWHRASFTWNSWHWIHQRPTMEALYDIWFSRSLGPTAAVTPLSNDLGLIRKFEAIVSISFRYMSHHSSFQPLPSCSANFLERPWPCPKGFCRSEHFHFKLLCMSRTDSFTTWYWIPTSREPATVLAKAGLVVNNLGKLTRSTLGIMTW